jgi:hypothetical protein
MNDVITIVSGLSRSGTSMMIQMLGAGDMEVFMYVIRHLTNDTTPSC